MRYKSLGRNSISDISIHAWRWSATIHVGVLLLVFAAALKKTRVETMDFTVYESPGVSSAAQPKAIEIAKPKTEPVEKKRAVYGIARNAIESDSGIEVKRGNTTAKQADQIALKNDDANALPVPADEYLVSKMPKLKAEVRIPYPADAKSAGIQGAVILDLLIDSNGRVRDVKFVSGPAESLNSAALAAVRNFEFEPAKIEDKTVAVRIRYAYRFVLE